MFTQAMTVALDETAQETERWLPVQEVARICCMSTDWIVTRIDDQVLEANTIEGCYHLSASCIPRIQHMAVIERQFDADPQLAAIVADLAEDVRSLREQLAFHLRGG